MKRMWTGTAAAAALATAFAIPVAFAQETQQGKQAPSGMESGAHHQMGQGQAREQAGEKAQGQTTHEQAGKPGMKGESAQTQGQQTEPGKAAQAQERRTEPGKAAQTQERRTEPGKAAQTQERRTESGKAAQTQERTEPGKAAQTQERRTEPGKAAQTQERTEPGKAAQTGSAANQNRTGQAETGMQNRQGAAQTGQSGKSITAQNVQTMGKTNIPHDKAAKVAQTLMASGTTQSTTNININEVSVGANLPADVVINPLPATIVELVPAFRGYDYIVVSDEIIIIDPATRQVVEIIEGVG